MKIIKLTQNKVAFVDDEDFEYLNKFKWYAQKGGNTFYAVRNEYLNGKHKQIRMHRVVLSVLDKKIMVDHADRNGLNNTKLNLRLCDNAENQWNTGLSICNTSGIKGIDYDKSRNKWRVQLRHKGRKYTFGRFINLQDAINVYNRKVKELRNKFLLEPIEAQNGN